MPRAGALARSTSPANSGGGACATSTPAGAPIELANEIRLPVGERIDRAADERQRHPLVLDSVARRQDRHDSRPHDASLARADAHRHLSRRLRRVLRHLARADGVSGRRARAERPSTLAGREQRGRRASPSTAEAGRGRDAVPGNGCGACHTVRGTGAAGVDRTRPDPRRQPAQPRGRHAAERRTDASRRWIAHPTRIKPGAHMPAFGMLGRGRLQALAAYLDGLR